jgi:transposase-like protein
MEDAAIIAPHFSDPDKAREFLEAKRWPDGPVCPHCGVIGEAYRLTADLESKKATTHARKGVWKCAACREQFTVTVGTIMEDSHIPLNKWLLAFHLLCASKKGMSAHQLHRMLGVTYKSAWFMAHRIRYAMTQEPLSSKLDGIVEVDETYVGGKFRNLQKWQQREPGLGPKKRRNPVGNKAAVASVLQRNGRVQSMHVERVAAENLKPIIEQMVCESAHIPPT